MGLRQITPPTGEPITVAEAMEHCRADDAEHEPIINGLIKAARAHVEAETRRAFGTQTWELTLDYEWQTRIVLPKPPIISVVSVQYVDIAGATQTLAANQYLVNTTGDEGVIEPAYGITWPSVRKQMNAVTVRFTCGYTTTPPDIAHAMKLLVAYWYMNTEAAAPSAVSELPMAVSALLFPYRVFY